MLCLSSEGLEILSRSVSWATHHSKCFLHHPLGDMVGLTNGQCNDGLCRVSGRAGAEGAAVADKQIVDIVRLSPSIRHAIFRILAHACDAHVVAAYWRPLMAAEICRSQRGVDSATLFDRVVAHYIGVGMVCVF